MWVVGSKRNMLGMGRGRMISQSQALQFSSLAMAPNVTVHLTNNSQTETGLATTITRRDKAVIFASEFTCSQYAIISVHRCTHTYHHHRLRRWFDECPRNRHQQRSRPCSLIPYLTSSASTSAHASTSPFSSISRYRAAI